MIRDSIRDRCRSRWPSILMQLGFPREALTGNHTACPCCGGQDRFRFIDADGEGTAYCNQCGGRGGTGGSWTGGAFLVMEWRKVNYRGACELIEEVVGKAALTPQRRERAGDDQVSAAMKWAWANASPLTGEDPPSRYLQSRGIDVLPPGSAVRYCAEMPDYVPALKRKLYRPAMLSRLVNSERGALHITFLTLTGEKANIEKVKRFFTGAHIPASGAVRLGPAAEFMGVSTGLETSMSASLKHNGMSVWATLTDVGLLKFLPPPECRHLTIFSDNDELFSGQQASISLAYALAHAKTGLKIVFKLPPDGFKDWNDVVMAEMNATNIHKLRVGDGDGIEDGAGEGGRSAADREGEREGSVESPQAIR